MRVLVTVKAYPGLSVRRGETVCVAGVRVDTEVPEWVRLYPVAYRDLPTPDQFTKYQLVDLRARKSSDPRPESYAPNLGSLVLREVVATGRDRQWQARWRLLDDLAGATSTCGLLRAQDGRGPKPSLGMIKPIVQDLIIEPNAAFDADKAQLAVLAAAEDLFGAAKTVLEPAPFTLIYRYKCADDPDCRGHRSPLIDWEAGEAARKWRGDGASDDELPRLLRGKFLDQMCASDRDTYFFVGNQFAYPRGFLVLGVFWPPAGSRPPRGLF
jgi:hypothetical protein